MEKWEYEGTTLYHGDAIEVLPEIETSSVNCCFSDPPYPEIDRDYGRLDEMEWGGLIRKITLGLKRVLVDDGSATFVLQPNSYRVGSMRPWLWEYLAWCNYHWNVVQDWYWWNYTAAPNVHCHEVNGLGKPSLKYFVWLGNPKCYRNQDVMLWHQSETMERALKSQIRAWHLKKGPSGFTVRQGRISNTVDRRGGVTPFNVIPLSNANSTSDAGTYGHGAGTPLQLCKRWVEYTSRKEDIVIDPFCGSGSVGIAAISLGRNFIGIEKEKKYFEISKKRIAGAYYDLIARG